MEFLVDFELNVPEGTPESDVKQRGSAEAAAAGHLAREGHLVRLWRPLAAQGELRAVTQLQTAAPGLDWLNKGVFISVGGRRPGGVTYETYLVG